MSDTPTPGAAEEPVDRSKMIKQLLKQAENGDAPFEVRKAAVHALRVELPGLPEIESTDDQYAEAAAAQGSDAYRGLVAGLSPKSKAGQLVLQRLKKAVLGALKPAKDPAAPKAPREPKAKKTPDRPCLCGCGTLVHNNFAPGHDAKVHGLLLKISRGQAQLSELPATLAGNVALKDLAIKWHLPTDADGNLVVTPLPEKAPKAPKAAKSDTPAG